MNKMSRKRLLLFIVVGTIIMKCIIVCLTMWSLEMWIATFRLLTAGLRAMGSAVCAPSFISRRPAVISEEKKHLSSVLVSNGYPSSFVHKITKKRTAPRREPVAEFKSTAVLPYIQGVSEPLRRCLEQQGIRTVFKSDTTLRSHLVRPKDTVDPAKQDGVVYRIPCECGKVYIGETGRSMQERIKEHDRDIRLARTQTSAVSEHAHETGHYPIWNEVKFIDRDPHWYTRRVKEAIHIRLHPNNINRDNGIEIPQVWMPTIKKHNNRRTVQQRTAEATTHRNNEGRNAPITADLRDVNDGACTVGLIA